MHVIWDMLNHELNVTTYEYIWINMNEEIANYIL